jgi:hypothetical protein
MNSGDKRFFIHDAFTSIIIADKGMEWYILKKLIKQPNFVSQIN